MDKIDKDGVTVSLKGDDENKSDILSLSKGNISENLNAESNSEASEKEKTADSNFKIVSKLNSNEAGGDEADSNEAGGHEAGGDESSSDEAGGDKASRDEAGSDETVGLILSNPNFTIAAVNVIHARARHVIDAHKPELKKKQNMFLIHEVKAKLVILYHNIILNGDIFTPHELLPVTKRLLDKDVDIVGLDALQSLALKEDHKELESYLPPRRSRYKLLTKKESKTRRAAELKLEKKRRRNIALLEPGCTWHYECREPHDLDTCHLKAHCKNETLSNGYMDEQNINMESLDEYFNRLVVAHHAGTTPISSLKLNTNNNTEDSNAEDSNSVTSDSSKRKRLYRKTEKVEEPIKKSKIRSSNTGVENSRNIPHIVKLVKPSPRFKQETTTSVAS
ncbi:unnamed protein product [Arctia plantaginis]|uniref:Uncharacterized protein n=1 Tax=Arctia plantaginis TaxID=874455 RepID=A0A8S1AKW3_ARCPL|nr:unnamed protein product [Arctia plantaginis]